MPNYIEQLTSALQTSYARYKDNPSPENRAALTDSMLEINLLYAHEGMDEEFGKNMMQLIKLNNSLLSDEQTNRLADNFSILTQKIRDRIFQHPEILDSLFTLMLELKINPQCKNYVALYKSIHRFRKIWKGYIDFCRWWNFENFTALDYVIEPGAKMSLAESALIFYTKRLINTDFHEDLAKLAVTFIRNLSKYPLTIYSNYYIAKLLVRLKYNNALIRRILRPFMITKAMKPWGWHLMSKTFNCNDEFIEKFSCLLLALEFGKVFPATIVNDIYLDLAMMFHNINELPQTKFFLEIFLKIRREAGYKIPFYVKKITEKHWYATTAPLRPDTSLEYKENCRNILRRTTTADTALYEWLCQDLTTRFPESIQWSQDWYDTMNEGERIF
jgi:hypothetical protein